MNNISRGIILVLVALYVLSPIDAFPGIIDDIAIVLLGVEARRRIAEGGNKKLG